MKSYWEYARLQQSRRERLQGNGFPVFESFKRSTCELESETAEVGSSDAVRRALRRLAERQQLCSGLVCSFDSWQEMEAEVPFTGLEPIEEKPPPQPGPGHPAEEAEEAEEAEGASAMPATDPGSTVSTEQASRGTEMPPDDLQEMWIALGLWLLETCRT